MTASPARERANQRRWTVLLPVVGLIGLGVCGLVLLGLGTSRIGAGPILVGAVAALVPVVAVLSAFLWVDRWEPEPAKILLLAFAWGACGATITSLVFNQTAHVLGELINDGDGSTFAAVVGAPIVEEATKAAFVIALFLRRRDEFDGVVDGIVYAGVTAAGFAYTENIYYFARVFVDSGFGDLSSGVVALFVLRGVLSPFAHPLFTAMTGIGVGIASMTANRKLRVVAPVLGYLGAAGLHSLWNFSTTVGTGTTFINLYFLIMVPLFAGMVWLVVWQRRREQRIVAGQLPEMAARRWIAASEVTLLASLQGRRRWRRAVRRKVGDQAARAVAGYQVAATELAFLRHRMEQGTAGADAGERHSALLEALVAARQAAVDAPGALKAAGGVRRS
ncbi:PrsW family intramembrane metalloprotease [Saccharothrix algeriensis]|uniref:PrsW family intramembrane metalloprotease n=1 Tax=Saccharothrix algeriensis TaxID=173560 RepID=A0A8T8I4S1_9PSEU|nr:PrsW family intramembrane metalloprotease [Saccharothrix algeriensis]MBM7811835.1 RsiW-degrading membrane proteinase PrsW (M82 family) [Saccharothrix algeriensis]QTR05568.1 PrsW family intramembrane metalloprotease [Saccharothrix algeriensis]